MKIRFGNRSPRPRVYRRADLMRLLRRAAAVTGCLAWGNGAGDAGELTVALIGPRRMRQINRQFLGHDYVTDVMAFDLGPAPDGNGGARTGEIYVCPAAACENAGRFATSAPDETLLCIVHGMLHLAGHDDGDAAARRRMRRHERRVMERLRNEFVLDALIRLCVQDDRRGSSPAPSMGRSASAGAEAEGRRHRRGATRR